MPNLRNHLRRVRSTDEEISYRIVILSSIIVIAFLIVFGRLVYLQAFQYDSYTEKKDDYTSIVQYVSAPRGQIYDTNGKLLAATAVSHNIVYTSPKNMDTDDYKLYAKRIVSVFKIDTDDFSTQQKKEAYITWKSFLSPNNEEYAANHLLTKAERRAYSNGIWGDDAETRRHAILMKRIGKDELNEMSKKQLKTAVVYQRMMSNATSGQENVVLEDVSDNDVAYLVEHKSDFPGFDVDFGGWKREYPYDDTLSDILGSVSTSTEGLPADNVDYYLQRGYQYNATVGKSGLEYQYNDVLSGTAQESKITYDSQGLAKQTVTRSAVKGNDIYLSIDIDMQKSLDETIKSVLKEHGGANNRENFSTLFTCMMDPNTGGIIAMSGYQKDLDTDKMTYFSSGNYQSMINPGSSVKGATVYMGLSEGVIKPGEVINDVTMNVGGQEFGSYMDHGPVDDETALEVSSNVYMFNIAIRLGGDSYTYGEALHIDDVKGTLNKMRSYYSMFGLGNKTGVDAPGEVAGYMGVGFEPGMLLNYSIGQMDMYTPLQMLVYVSTIAADGKAYQPSFMKEIREVNSDQVIESGGNKLIHVLPKKNQKYLKRVQTGFRLVVSSGNASDDMQALTVPNAGKTGTAEVQSDWTTAVFVGYAPYEDPTVAYACVAPTSSVNTKDVAENICTYNVLPEVIAKYFELHPAKDYPTQNDNSEDRNLQGTSDTEQSNE